MAPIKFGGGVKRAKDDDRNGMADEHEVSKKIKMEMVLNKNVGGSKSFPWKRRGNTSKTIHTNQLMDIRSFFGSGEQRTPKGI